jgi:hypothetical protein
MTETMSAAEYQARYGRKATLKLNSVLASTCVKKGRSSLSEPPTIDSIEKSEGMVKITLAGLIPGLNGKNGLIREPYWNRIKRKKNMMIRLMALNIPKFKSKVEISLKFYHSILADEDGLHARFKIIGDCFVDMGVLLGDSPAHLSMTKPVQEKSRRKDQKAIIQIKSI